jgi:hypothetical protein
MTTYPPASFRFRTRTKDVGVAIVLLGALALGFVLMQVVSNRTKEFQDATTQFRIAYPANWTLAESLQQVLLKVEDPASNSTFKTALTIEARELDPTAPPSVQTLVDRRVEQRSALTAYHFISDNETSVHNQPARELRYTYVVQPIDTPRRAALPVVVIARDYIIRTPDRAYFITLAAAENEFDAASARLDRILQTVSFP